MPKDRCIFLDYETNTCSCRNGEQCEGRETCDDFQEEEGD